MSQSNQCFGPLFLRQCFTSVCVLGCRVPLVVIIILSGVFEAHSLDKCFSHSSLLFEIQTPVFQLWPNLQLMSSSRNLTIHCFPFWVFPPQQVNQTLGSSTQVAGLVSLEMISYFWPKDYGVIDSLNIGINTTVFPSCEDPQPALEWTNVNLFGCWLVLRYTFSLE